MQDKNILNDESIITKKILWTGGWDSTYRIVELSKKKVNIKAYYVYGDKRLSENYEIKAMNKIMKNLIDRKETKAHFHSIEFIDKHEIPQNEQITSAYFNILKKQT